MWRTLSYLTYAKVGIPYKGESARIGWIQQHGVRITMAVACQLQPTLGDANKQWLLAPLYCRFIPSSIKHQQWRSCAIQEPLGSWQSPVAEDTCQELQGDSQNTICLKRRRPIWRSYHDGYELVTSSPCAKASGLVPRWDSWVSAKTPRETVDG